MDWQAIECPPALPLRNAKRRVGKRAVVLPLLDAWIMRRKTLRDAVADLLNIGTDHQRGEHLLCAYIVTNIESFSEYPQDDSGGFSLSSARRVEVGCAAFPSHVAVGWLWLGDRRDRSRPPVAQVERRRSVRPALSSYELPSWITWFQCALPVASSQLTKPLWPAPMSRNPSKMKPRGSVVVFESFRDEADQYSSVDQVARGPSSHHMPILVPFLWLRASCAGRE